MSLNQLLKDKSPAARKANDVVAKTIYGVLMGEIARSVDPGKDVDDATVSKIAEKTVAGIQTTMDKGGVTEVLLREKALLTEFVIAKISDADVGDFVNEYLTANPDLTMKQMGQVMGALKARFGAENLDNGAASNIVKAALL